MTDLTPGHALAASAIIRVRATREDRPHWLPIADALAGWANRHAPTTDRQDADHGRQ